MTKSREISFPIEMGLSPVRSIIAAPLSNIVSPLAGISPRPDISHNVSEMLVSNVENAPTASSPDPTYAQAPTTMLRVGRFLFGSGSRNVNGETGSRNVTTRTTRQFSQHSIDLADPIIQAVDEHRLLQNA